MSFREKKTNHDLKAGLNAADLRAKRTENAISLRKQQREEHLAQRRRPADVDDDVSGMGSGAAVEPYDSQELVNLVNDLNNPDEGVVAKSAYRIRQLLSLDRNPPIDAFVELNAVPILIKLLNTGNHKIVFESAWALTNIASGTSANTSSVVKHGGIPMFTRLLDSTDDDVRDQAVWALGNISGESPEYRDMVLREGVMRKLLNIAHSQVKLCMLRNVAWTISNLCRGRKPHPPFHIVSDALPTLYNMIHFNDEDVIGDACWAISYLSDDVGGDDLPENSKIESVVNAGVVQRLVQLLHNVNFHVKTPALRAIGNIVTGNNAQTDHVLEHGVLGALYSLLDCPRRSIRKEACWTISNIVAGTPAQVQRVTKANIFVKLLEMIPTAEASIKKEIAFSFSNALANKDPELIHYFIQIGIIPAIAILLKSEDVDLLAVVLETLNTILLYANSKYGNVENIIATNVEASGILEILEYIQLHVQSDAIYKFAYQTATTYFPHKFSDALEQEEGQSVDNVTAFNF